MLKTQASTLRVILFLLSVYLGIAVYIALCAPLSVAAFLYSEEGPYEKFSIGLWLLLGVFTLFNSALQTQTRIGASIAALLMAARELDLHKSLFSMSFIKTKFYKSSDISWHDKLEGGLLLLAIATLGVYLLVRLTQHVRQHGMNSTSSIMLLGGLILGACSKVLDRLSSQLNELFRITLASDTRLVIVAMEESLEMLIPLMLILALLAYRRLIR